MAEKSGLFAILRRPAVYDFVQWLFRAERNRAWFAGTYLRAREGERMLDVGCGTADILRYLPRVDYVGFEPNPDYVAAARAAHGAAGTFHAGFFDAAAAAALAPVDLALVGAVLHHMDDAQATELFALLRRVVKPGGRVVTIDNVYAPGQNPVAKLLIGLDRGRHVRAPEAYAALAAPHFGSVTGEVVHQAWPPYTFWIMTAR
ncbi:class I SAM-dependent methyltransferase [Falsiroseomonas sp. HW251]|uniref:class I SAM-dependent methyltransferase n=1 Tax=Falsiroseomonas sp. HW251 TaxID=3390998 RepID=UPI003D31224B